MSAVSESPSLIKYEKVKSDRGTQVKSDRGTSPEEKRKRRRKFSPATAFSKNPFTLTVDPKVSDYAYRVWNFLNTYEWYGQCPMSNPEIALAMGKSESYVKRATRELRGLGLLKAWRERGKANTYTAVTPLPPVEQGKEHDDAERCPRCRKYVRPLGDAPWCRECAREIKIMQVSEKTAELVYDRRKRMEKSA